MPGADMDACFYLDAYWPEPGRLPPLIRRGEKTVGLALIHTPASTGSLLLGNQHAAIHGSA
jgi:predicted acetyltransferase